MRKLSRKSAIVVAAATTVVLVGGAGAYAAHDANTIHGCYDKTSGTLRVADTCRANEAAIEWNKQGPQGPPAPTARQLRVVDAEGETVGPLVALQDPLHDDGSYSRHHDLTLVDGLIWGMDAETGRFRGAYLHAGNVVFTTSDCSGQPYLWQHGAYAAFFSPGSQTTFELLSEGQSQPFVVDGPKVGADSAYSWHVSDDGTKICTDTGHDNVLVIPVRAVTAPPSVSAPTTITY